jgi:O-antigen/teichoic acid export membrane protein
MSNLLLILRLQLFTFAEIQLRTRRIALSQLTTLVFGLPISWFLVVYFGMVGAALASCIVISLSSTSLFIIEKWIDYKNEKEPS